MCNFARIYVNCYDIYYSVLLCVYIFADKGINLLMTVNIFLFFRLIRTLNNCIYLLVQLLDFKTYNY